LWREIWKVPKETSRNLSTKPGRITKPNCETCLFILLDG
jgi:hypothetical protein